MSIRTGLTRILGGAIGGLALAVVALPAWARPVLNVKMTLGLTVRPEYWYVVALSRGGSPGPTANLTDVNVRVSGNDVTFMRDWDYLIRVKPINDQSLLQSTIQRRGDIEQEFATGFNEVRLSRTTRDRDTINLVIDLSTLEGLDPTNQDIHVGLVTIKAPFTVGSDETLLALDSVRGNSPHHYRLSLTDQRQVQVNDPQRQETLRRSRDLINLSGSGLTGANIEGGSLQILAANILTFDLEVVNR